MIDYEVGQVPTRGLGVVVKDDRDNAMNLLGYTTVRAEILGSDNERVDMTGVTVITVPSALGTFVLNWPKDRSLFTQKGKYLLRFALEKNDGSRDYTRAYEIRVREFGRIN